MDDISSGNAFGCANRPLTNTLRGYYKQPLSDAEINESASNLLAFMELLIEIDMEHGIARVNESRVHP